MLVLMRVSSFSLPGGLPRAWLYLTAVMGLLPPRQSSPEAESRGEAGAHQEVTPVRNGPMRRKKERGARSAASSVVSKATVQTRYGATCLRRTPSLIRPIQETPQQRTARGERARQPGSLHSPTILLQSRPATMLELDFAPGPRTRRMRAIHGIHTVSITGTRFSTTFTHRTAGTGWTRALQEPGTAPGSSTTVRPRAIILEPPV